MLGTYLQNGRIFLGSADPTLRNAQFLGLRTSSRNLLEQSASVNTGNGQSAIFEALTYPNLTFDKGCENNTT